MSELEMALLRADNKELKKDLEELIEIQRSTLKALEALQDYIEMMHNLLKEQMEEV